jgi:polyhydroxyalkanoate synthase
MKDVLSREPPHGEPTLNGSSAALPEQARATSAQSSKEDPWITLLERLWETNPVSEFVPLNVGEMLSVLQYIRLDLLNNPTRLWTLYGDFLQKSAQIMTTSALKVWGRGQGLAPLIEPEKGDRRFNAPDWQQNPFFAMLKQSYLLLATTCLKSVSGITGLDDRERQRLTLVLRQFIDALSPTNFALTNPQVIHETIATGGQNLLRGTQHLLRDIAQGQIQITDPHAFTVGKDLAITPGQVVYRNKLIELIQYTPRTGQVYSIPILHMPPWVNKYYLLDLQPQNSLMKFLVDQGFTVFLMSWKNPDISMQDISFDDYVTLGPLAALDVVKQITGSPTVNTAGYCIAGQLLATVVPYLAATGDEETIHSASFVVTMADTQAKINDLLALIDEPALRVAERYLEAQGCLESSSMALMFNLLRANDLIWSNVINNYWLGKESPAFDVLFWNVDGTRVTRKAHTFFMRKICLENGLTRHGELVIKGVPIDLRRIQQDVYAMGTQQDHIVPWQAAWRMTQLVGGSAHFVLGRSGHVAGVVAAPQTAKGYWTNEKPLQSADEWMEDATFHQGSWWFDWVEWLKPRSGEQIAPPSMGSQAYPPLTPAPGTYVLEK